MTRIGGGRWAERRIATAIVGGILAVGLIAAALVGYRGVTGTATRTYVAEFRVTPGLYAHNSVDILGVPTGSITSIAPDQDVVRVRMRLPADVRIPADARAVLMAPNPVSDRFVELYPPYTGGPVLADGATIPVTRTAVPLELDQIFDNLDNLATTLGPTGANADGSVDTVLHSLAALAAGNGDDLHQTLVSIAQALPAFTADPQRVASLLTGLDQLTRTLSRHDTSLNRLYGDLATATGQLAAERDTLGAAIANLQGGLAQLTTFLKANQAHLTGSTSQLATATQAVVDQQKALIDTFDTAALGFQNFANAINPNAPCATGTGHCPAISVRIDLPSDVGAIVNAYCGSTAQNALPILGQSLGVGSADTINTLCVYEYSTEQGSRPAPGAPKTPALGLAEFLR